MGDQSGSTDLFASLSPTVQNTTMQT